MKFRNMILHGEKISAAWRPRRRNPFSTLLPALTPTELGDEELALEFHKCFTMRN
jgi:hypothetical protein